MNTRLITLLVSLAAGLCGAALAAVPADLCNDCRMEKYAHCGGFLEGATVNSAGQLWVVDLLGGRILQVGSDGTCSERANTGGQPNGAKFGPDGQLWIADKQLGLLRLDIKTGKLTTIANSFRSEKLRGLNDIVFDKAGGLYFTEPYGSGALKPDGRLFYLPPGANAKLQLVAGNLAFPNGVVLTGDGNTLLVGEYALKRITSIPTPSSPNDFDTSFVWATTSAGVGPDGMLMLADGTLLAANFDAGELLAFDSKGRALGTIPVPAGPRVTNMALRDDWLYVTEGSSGEVWRVRLIKH
jgi:gluconolactonase